MRDIRAWALAVPALMIVAILLGLEPRHSPAWWWGAAANLSAIMILFGVVLLGAKIEQVPPYFNPRLRIAGRIFAACTVALLIRELFTNSGYELVQGLVQLSLFTSIMVLQHARGQLFGPLRKTVQSSTIPS